MWNRLALGVGCVVGFNACASSRVYEDAKYQPEKGYFTVDREADGIYFGNLSGYYGDRSLRSDAISREFWARTEQFCGGEVEKLSDDICVVHFKAGAPDTAADPGWCKMDKFRCKAPA